MTTNYRKTLILPSPDCTAARGSVPSRPSSVAGLQHALLAAHPYRYTSDDLLFEVHAARAKIPSSARDSARQVFFAKPNACLRASPLVKQFGWALHHDEEEHVALVAVGGPDYVRLLADGTVRKTPGMRSKRATD